MSAQNQQRQAVWADFAQKMTAGVGNRDTETHRNETALAFARTYILLEVLKDFQTLREKVNQEHKKSEDMGNGGYGMDESQLQLVEELDKVEKRLTFLYQYLMFFRSKHGRELSVKLRRRLIDAKEHQSGMEQISDVAH